MSADALLEKVRDYYTDKLRKHGATPAGVDWNSTASQENRFKQLMRVCEGRAGFTLGDFGCGYGAMADYVRNAGWDCEFRGFDIAPDMVAEARKRYPGLIFGSEESAIADCDFVVASGVMNVKQGVPTTEWEAYVHRTVDKLAALANKGFAFNALTSYSDADRMRPDLYYADPCRMFDYCKRRFSRNVALLHDYDLYEFTVLVRLA